MGFLFAPFPDDCIGKETLGMPYDLMKGLIKLSSRRYDKYHQAK